MPENYSEEIDRKRMLEAQVVYNLRVLDDDWEEIGKARIRMLTSQEAIEELLKLLDEEDDEAKLTVLVPGALVPAKCFILEGFYRA